MCDTLQSATGSHLINHNKKLIDSPTALKVPIITDVDMWAGQWDVGGVEKPFRFSSCNLFEPCQKAIHLMF